MHSEAIGVAKMPMVALSYAVVAAALLACAKYAVTAPKTESVADPHAHGGAALGPAT
jgi:hypothetical protein